MRSPRALKRRLNFRVGDRARSRSRHAAHDGTPRTAASWLKPPRPGLPAQPPARDSSRNRLLPRRGWRGLRKRNPAAGIRAPSELVHRFSLRRQSGGWPGCPHQPSKSMSNEKRMIQRSTVRRDLSTQHWPDIMAFLETTPVRSGFAGKFPETPHIVPNGSIIGAHGPV